MSDLSRIKHRLKKSNTDFTYSNHTLVAGPTKIYFDKSKCITGIFFFEMRLDIDNCIDLWRNKQ